VVLVQLVAELALHRMEKSRFAKCWSGEGGGEIAEILQQRDEKTRQLPDPAEDARTMETQRYCPYMCHVAHLVEK